MYGTPPTKSQKRDIVPMGPPGSHSYRPSVPACPAERPSRRAWAVPQSVLPELGAVLFAAAVALGAGVLDLPYPRTIIAFCGQDPLCRPPAILVVGSLLALVPSIALGFICGWLMLLWWRVGRPAEVAAIASAWCASALWIYLVVGPPTPGLVMGILMVGLAMAAFSSTWVLLVRRRMSVPRVLAIAVLSLAPTFALAHLAGAHRQQVSMARTRAGAHFQVYLPATFPAQLPSGYAFAGRELALHSLDAPPRFPGRYSADYDLGADGPDSPIGFSICSVPDYGTFPAVSNPCQGIEPSARFASTALGVDVYGDAGPPPTFVR